MKICHTWCGCSHSSLFLRKPDQIHPGKIKKKTQELFKIKIWWYGYLTRFKTLILKIWIFSSTITHSFWRNGWDMQIESHQLSNSQNPSTDHWSHLHPLDPVEDCHGSCYSRYPVRIEGLPPEKTQDFVGSQASTNDDNSWILDFATKNQEFLKRLSSHWNCAS